MYSCLRSVQLNDYIMTELDFTLIMLIYSIFKETGNMMHGSTSLYISVLDNIFAKN
jgi:hypothetical protein